MYTSILRLFVVQILCSLHKSWLLFVVVHSSLTYNVGVALRRILTVTSM